MDQSVVVMSIETILALLAALIAVITGVFFKGKSDGKKDARKEQETAVAKQQVITAKQAKEVEQDVKQKTDHSVSDALKSRWVQRK